MARPRIARREYVICSESGGPVLRTTDRSAAIHRAACAERPCYVEERVEYAPEQRVIWASHGSMLEDA